MPTLSETSSSSNSSSSEDEAEELKSKNDFIPETTERNVPQNQIQTEHDSDPETDSKDISVDIHGDAR